MQPHTLSEITEALQTIISDNFCSPIWLTAEAHQIKISGGHCYLNLIENNPITHKVQAQISAHIWRNALNGISKKLRGSIGCEIVDLQGALICIYCEVSYSELYGISLNIIDIDPLYSLGESEMKRRQTIQKITQMRADEWNKALPIPQLVQRIAVISSPTAAGYIDFMNHLTSNSFGYQFQVTLFEAIMQGTNAPDSICKALSEIEKNAKSYDITVIIRGGGSKMDLAAFDDEKLAMRAAKHTLPVISGIGHEIDNSILDLVAAIRVKTPTHAADWLINRMQVVDEQISFLQERLIRAVTGELDYFKEKLNRNARILQSASMERIYQKKSDLIAKKERINNLCQTKIMAQNHRIDLLEQTLKLLDPQTILKRGYAYLMLNNEAVKSVKQLQPDNEIKIVMHDGALNAVVSKKK